MRPALVKHANIAAARCAALCRDDADAIVGAALARAIVKYDPSNGALFTTYAISCISNAARQAVRDHSGRKRDGTLRPVVLSYDPEVGEQAHCHSPHDAVDDADYDADVSARIAAATNRLLDDRQRAILQTVVDGGRNREVMELLKVGTSTAWKAARDARQLAKIGVFASGDERLVMAVAGRAL